MGWKRGFDRTGRGRRTEVCRTAGDGSFVKQIERYSKLLKEYSRPRTELVEYMLDSDSANIVVTTSQPRWLCACFDFTRICEFILECVQTCVEDDLGMEVAYLRAHDATVRDLEGWLDMRQAALNTLIDVIVQNRGTLSNSKRKLVEGLSEEAAQRIVKTANEHFAEFIDRAACIASSRTRATDGLSQRRA